MADSKKEKSFETDQKLSKISKLNKNAIESNGIIHLANFEHAKKLSMNLLSPNGRQIEQNIDVFSNNRDSNSNSINSKANKKQCLK